MKTITGICLLIIGILIWLIIKFLIKTIKAEIHVDEFIIRLIISLLGIMGMLLVIYTVE